MFLWLPYFCPKSFVCFLHPVVGMFSSHFLPIVDRIFFRCFGKFCFVCIVLLFVDISLIFLLWPALSGLFPQVYCYFSCVACSFSPLISAPLSFFIILARIRSFLFAFPVEFPIPVLIVSSCNFLTN